MLLFQAHLVAAFEQSLGNMTIRLKSLTLTAEQKVRNAGNGIQSQHAADLGLSLQDTELTDLRKTIELLKKQNAVAQAAINGVINTPELVPKGDKTGTDPPQARRALPRLESKALSTEEVCLNILSWQQRQPSAAAARPAHQEAALLRQRQQHQQRHQPLQRGLQHGRRRQEQEEKQEELGTVSTRRPRPWFVVAAVVVLPAFLCVTSLGFSPSGIFHWGQGEYTRRLVLEIECF